MSLDPSGLPYKMREIHEHLTRARMGHAFGGALSLAWCTQQARGTIDLDLNVFVPSDRADDVIAALPPEVAATPGNREHLESEGQARLWWGPTPIDLFLNTTSYHDEIAVRVRWEPFAGTQLPFLACQDLAVFKAFFGRTKDWADLEAMVDAGSLDVAAVAGVLVRFLGAGDDRVARLLAISDAARG